VENTGQQAEDGVLITGRDANNAHGMLYGRRSAAVNTHKKHTHNDERRYKTTYAHRLVLGRIIHAVDRVATTLVQIRKVVGRIQLPSICAERTNQPTNERTNAASITAPLLAVVARSKRGVRTRLGVGSSSEQLVKHVEGTLTRSLIRHAGLFEQI